MENSKSLSFNIWERTKQARILALLPLWGSYSQMGLGHWDVFHFRYSSKSSHDTGKIEDSSCSSSYSITNIPHLVGLYAQTVHDTSLQMGAA
jgi:hypothetical protein